MPEISVIIVNWNGKRFLEACLSSLRAQTFREFEAILVDNGSEDSSVEYVRQNFPEVEIVQMGYNSGFVAANAAGYERARGNMIVLLNNDTEAHPEWLQELHRAAERFPTAGTFASKMLFFDDRRRIDNCGFAVTTSGTTIDLGRGEFDGPQWSEYAKVFGACGGAVGYRRSMLQDIGFLDSDFVMIYEDFDLSFRAQLHGYDCVSFPGIVFHRLNGTISKFPAHQVFHSQRNIEYVFWKNMPASLMVRYLHQRIIYELGGALFFARRGAGLAFFRAKWSAITALPKLLRKRSDIQASRRISPAQLRSVLRNEWFGPKWRRFASAWRRPSRAVSASASAR